MCLIVPSHIPFTVLFDTHLNESMCNIISIEFVDVVFQFILVTYSLLNPDCNNNPYRNSNLHFSTSTMHISMSCFL